MKKQEKRIMTEETRGTEVATTSSTEVSTLGGRLGKSLVASEEEAPTPVLQLIEEALGEGEKAFKTDEFFEIGKALLEKTGLLEVYLTSKGVETEGNISEWRPVLAPITTGKGKSAADLRHLSLDVIYNHGTKTAVDLTDRYFPVFIHAEEILKDDSGMNVEDRITVPYNSKQEAFTPGYDYQNIVYLLNRSLNEVFKINVKSSGHKFVTNLLRNYMFSNYKQGMMFNLASLKHWMILDVVSHTSKSGFTNPYARLTSDAKAKVTSDEAKLITIIQRSQFDIFRKLLAKSKAEQAEADETQDLVDQNTTTDASGDNFTQL